MHPVDRPISASEAAATWWVRLQSESLSYQDREAFVDWLRASPERVSEMLALAQVHGALERFAGWTRLPDDAGKSATITPAVTQKALWARPHRRWALAACGALLCIGVSLFSMLHLRDASIQTQVGERREVALADGSVLDIDPDSYLSIHFDSAYRRIVLERGRVYFRVAKDRYKPFLVETNGTTVRAVGTAFGVARSGADVIVTVEEGSVTVFSTAAPANDSHHVDLVANQQTTVHVKGADQLPHSVDGSKELSWARGRLVFENEPVAAEVAEFNRYNRVQLRVLDPTLGKLLVTGVFNATDPEAFIAFIASVTPIKVTRIKDKEIILEGKK